MLNRSRANLQQGIDLLGIHQFRRENAALQKQIDQQQLNICDIAERATLAQNAAGKAVTLVDKLSVISQKHASDQNTISSNLEDSNRKIKHLETQLPDFEATIDDKWKWFEQSLAALQGQYQSLQTRLLTLDSRFNTQLLHETVIQDLKACLSNKTDTEVANVLGKRLSVLEAKLGYAENLRSSVTHVDNSVKTSLGKGYGNGSSLDLQQPNLLHTDHNINNQSKDSEVMLTFNRRTQMASTLESEDLDLDSNVVSMSYAHNPQHKSFGHDSLIPLPEDKNLPLGVRDNVQSLKQGRLHSWDRYSTKLKALHTITPAANHDRLIREFVDGIYHPSLKEQISARLDEHGWTLNSLEELPEAFRQYSGPVTQPKAMIKDAATYKDVEREVVACEKVIKHNIHAPPRRSQRLLLKNVNSQIDMKMSNQRQKTRTPGMQSNPKHGKNARESVRSKTKAVQKRKTIQQDESTEAKPRKRRDHAVGPPSPTPFGIVARDNKLPIVNGQNNTTHQPLIEERSLATPSTQRTTAMTAAQRIPRLVPRRKVVRTRPNPEDSVEDIQEQEEEELPLLPSLVKIKSVQARKRHRFPLPPPPRIPILPTSDD